MTRVATDGIGAVLIVGPPDALAERVQEMADLFGTPCVEWTPDPETGVIHVELDPLGEVRVDDVAVSVARAKDGA